MPECNKNVFSQSLMAWLQGEYIKEILLNHFRAATVTQLQNLYQKSPGSVKAYLGASKFFYYDFDEDPYTSKFLFN